MVAPERRVGFDSSSPVTDAGGNLPSQLRIAEKRVVAGRSGTLPGRLILSKTVQAAVADTWMAVEAIPERLDPKRKMFGDLDRLAPEDAILARRCSAGH
jgi:3-hydroxybutyryl-CoA dehydrogenase